LLKRCCADSKGSSPSASSSEKSNGNGSSPRRSGGGVGGLAALAASCVANHSSSGPGGVHEGVTLMEQMVSFDPSRRIGVEEALGHPYLRDFSSEQDRFRAKAVTPADVEYDRLFDGVSASGEAAALLQLRRMLCREANRDAAPAPATDPGSGTGGASVASGNSASTASTSRNEGGRDVTPERTPLYTMTSARAATPRQAQAQALARESTTLTSSSSAREGDPEMFLGLRSARGGLGQQTEKESLSRRPSKAGLAEEKRPESLSSANRGSARGQASTTSLGSAARAHSSTATAAASTASALATSATCSQTAALWRNPLAASAPRSARPVAAESLAPPAQLAQGRNRSGRDAQQEHAEEPPGPPRSARLFADWAAADGSMESSQLQQSISQATGATPRPVTAVNGTSALCTGGGHRAATPPRTAPTPLRSQAAAPPHSGEMKEETQQFRRLTLGSSRTELRGSNATPRASGVSDRSAALADAAAPFSVGPALPAATTWWVSPRLAAEGHEGEHSSRGQQRESGASHYAEASAASRPLGYPKPPSQEGSSSSGDAWGVAAASKSELGITRRAGATGGPSAGSDDSSSRSTLRRHRWYEQPGMLYTEGSQPTAEAATTSPTAASSTSFKSSSENKASRSSTLFKELLQDAKAMVRQSFDDDMEEFCHRARNLGNTSRAAMGATRAPSASAGGGVLHNEPHRGESAAATLWQHVTAPGGYSESTFRQARENDGKGRRPTSGFKGGHDELDFAVCEPGRVTTPARLVPRPSGASNGVPVPPARGIGGRLAESASQAEPNAAAREPALQSCSWSRSRLTPSDSSASIGDRSSGAAFSGSANRAVGAHSAGSSADALRREPAEKEVEALRTPPRFRQQFWGPSACPRSSAAASGQSAFGGGRGLEREDELKSESGSRSRRELQKAFSAILVDSDNASLSSR
jgi:hypothetical protein